MNLQKSDIIYCKKIHKEFGKTYYSATRFFPKDLREATYILYAFFRSADNIVDAKTKTNVNEVETKLQQWKKDWEQAYHQDTSNEPVLRASAIIFKKYRIPFEYSEAFFDAMIQDLFQKRYNTYQDLEKYMYGSAAVVGLILSYVIGFSDKKALPYAEKLGYAMQLSNFLRDIREDYEDLDGRIYFPLDEMKVYNINEEDIKIMNVSENFKNFMKYQIDRARTLYKEAETGISMLSKRGRFAVRMSSKLYAYILRKIEKNNYDVFRNNCRPTMYEKVLILLGILK